MALGDHLSRPGQGSLRQILGTAFYIRHVQNNQNYNVINRQTWNKTDHDKNEKKKFHNKLVTLLWGCCSVPGQAAHGCSLSWPSPNTCVAQPRPEAEVQTRQWLCEGARNEECQSDFFLGDSWPCAMCLKTAAAERDLGIGTHLAGAPVAEPF